MYLIHQSLIVRQTPPPTPTTRQSVVHTVGDVLCTAYCTAGANNDWAQHEFPNYKLESDNLDKTDNTSRTGILMDRQLHYKRRRDLESPGLSTVWVQLSYPGRHPVLIQGLYRQHQRLGREGSKSIASQKARWDKILTKWELAAQEKCEIISMGDFNINSLAWDLPESQKASQDKVQAGMAEMFKQRILNKGFTLIGNQPTRTPDNPTSRPPALDLIVTNRLDKVESFHVGIPCFSDHHLQSLTRRTKNLQVTQNRIRIRSFKNFSTQTYRENIRNHTKYIETLYERDPMIITENLQKNH